MKKITAAKELENAIKTLEAKYKLEKTQLNEQMAETEKSISPVKIIKSKIKNWLVDSDIVRNLTSVAFAYASDSLLNRKEADSSKNKKRKILGAVLQLTATQVVSYLLSKKRDQKNDKK